jgi:hypothetical protein
MRQPPALGIGLALLAGGLLLWLIDRALDPVPVSAGPAFVLGAAAMIGRQAPQARRVATLALIGALAGALVHWNWHASGASPEPAGSLFLHLAWEGLLGLASAAAALAAAGAIMRALPAR